MTQYKQAQVEKYKLAHGHKWKIKKTKNGINIDIIGSRYTKGALYTLQTMKVAYLENSGKSIQAVAYCNVYGFSKYPIPPLGVSYDLKNTTQA